MQPAPHAGAGLLDPLTAGNLPLLDKVGLLHQTPRLTAASTTFSSDEMEHRGADGV